MVTVKRLDENPILTPNKQNSWESDAAFNGCVAGFDSRFVMLYRAIGNEQSVGDTKLKLSTIGLAQSSDGVHFTGRQQLLKPEFSYEKYGCEDPRVTSVDGTYYICYTALSNYPFSAAGIRVAVATTKDFKTVTRHPATTFNSKAMAVFPERIGGKLAAILTIHTDMPPARVGIALFDRDSDLWNKDFWDNWYLSLSDHIVPLLRSLNDHIEIGTPPIKTKEGWVLLYSYIRNYRSPYRLFGIEAVLLDLKDPHKVIGRINNPIMIPEKEYELYGQVPNVIFPTGSIIRDGEIMLYYGAADTTTCAATISLEELLGELVSHSPTEVTTNKSTIITLDRFEGNPIVQPRPYHTWESKVTFNAAAVYEGGKVHLLYRAMGSDDTSVLGYAASRDGFHFDQRLKEPVYTPREDFEKKKRPGNSGCEDPRLTKIDDRLYMCYTGYDAVSSTRVGLTSISITDFLSRQWNWTKPIAITAPGVNEKNACLFPEKIKNKYVILHRIDPNIWIDFVDDLEFKRKKYVRGVILIAPRTDKWDSEKVGIAGPPIKTKSGWLLIYHGVSREDRKYRLGALLLNETHPDHIIARLDHPILEPDAEYENHGLRHGTVFSCGAVLIDEILYVYYGGADQVVCVATVPLNKLLNALTE